MPTSAPAVRRSPWITAGLVVAGVSIGGLLAASLPALKIKFAALNSAREISVYIQSHSVRKLQLGAGSIDYPGWLNSDIEPGPGEVYLDATKRFPIPDGSVQYIFGEHVIEHLSYDNGLLMLRECYRVLAPGGKIRFATPNLLKYIQLFQEPKTREMQAYLGPKTEVHGWPHIPEPELMILNMEMRSFGHQFLYDPGTLSNRLTEAGFRMVAEFPPGESDDPQLRGIESRHNNSWKPVNDYESMVLQAVHP